MTQPAQPTLSGKHGPARAPLLPTEAAARLDAHDRVLRALAAAGPLGPLQAPVLYLSAEELTALFAPRQLEALVTRPLGPAPGAECPPP